jgi:type VI secretion system protein ImpA
MAQAGGGAPGPIASREDALKRLDEVAKWFRRTEPHSPLAYTLDEAVRRGRMTLPELLAEIVPDYATRSTILTSLGIKPPSEYEESSGYDQGSE